MLAMLPQKSTLRVSQASISPPTLSMAPPKRAASSGRLPSVESPARGSTSLRAERLQVAARAALPVTAIDS